MRNVQITEILGKKGNAVYTIRPDSTILDAVLLLVEKKVGSLVVTESGPYKVVGIITERDILNENARRHDRIHETKVEDVMTREVVFGRPEQTVDEVMVVMTTKRIRHLPILEADALVGIISIGDVVKTQLDEASDQIQHLSDYITGKYPR